MQRKLFQGRWRRFARTALAALAVLGAPAEASAAPALWVAADDDSRVYMLGTIHMLDPGVDWMNDRIAEAFFSSTELWLELDFRTDKTAGFAYIAQRGTSPGKTLASRLTPEDRAALEAGAKTIGVSVASMQGMRPWLATMMIGLAATRKAGLTDAGVDLTLMRDAEAEGMDIHAFETGAEQIAVFADLTEAQELEMLRATIRTLDDAVPTLKKMSAAWASGDVEALVALSDEDLKAAGAVFYERLLGDRNKRFADRIAEIMKGSGTAFVAVGAAHFAGEGSVLDFLAKQGVRVERLQ